MLFDSASEVYSLITLEDSTFSSPSITSCLCLTPLVFAFLVVRQTLSLSPQNLLTLLTTLTTHLSSLLSSPLFPTPPPTSAASKLTSYLPSSSPFRSPSSSSDTTKEALNCLRVVGRILPVLYETEGAGDDFGGLGNDARRVVQEMLWKTKEVLDEEEGRSNATLGGDGHGGGRSGEDQFVIDDEDSDSEAEGDGLGVSEDRPNNPIDKSSSSTPPNSTRRTKTLPSLAERLFECAIDLMFCEGFTLPPGVGGEEGEKINYCIWENGVGSTINVGSTNGLDENKVEVLRFFLLLHSTPIYTSPTSLPTQLSLPLQLLTHKTNRRLVLALLCSLLNTALNPSPAPLLGLPYAHLLGPGGAGIGGFGGGSGSGGAGGGEGREGLRKKAIQCLLVGLDYWSDQDADGGHRGRASFSSPPAPPPSGEGLGEGGVGESGDRKKGNAFRYFLSKLHRKEDLEFVLFGLMGVWEKHLAVANGLLPGSSKAPPILLETFMLFWRLIDCNKVRKPSLEFFFRQVESLKLIIRPLNSAPPFLALDQKFRSYILADAKRTVDVMVYTVFACLQLKDNLGWSLPFPAHNFSAPLTNHLFALLIHQPITASFECAPTSFRRSPPIKHSAPTSPRPSSSYPSPPSLLYQERPPTS
jgi:hypothetical protein